jgi:hypothetical protein
LPKSKWGKSVIAELQLRRKHDRWNPIKAKASSPKSNWGESGIAEIHLIAEIQMRQKRHRRNSIE